MFTFNGGDVIVLSIVVIILFVYRQLDKNNRSLERVKRFADQAQNQLAEVTEQQTTHLKDIAIEVDVHQQAVRAVFQRLKEAEQDFSERAQNIEEIKHRIDEYDRSIEALVQKTEVAQSNLQRVKDESRFIDGVGKRIREASSRIQDLEKRIPSIISDFDQKNTKVFEERGAAIVASLLQKATDSEERVTQAQANLQTTVQAMRQEVQDQQVELAQKMSGYRESLEQLEQQHLTKMADTAQKAQDLELSVFEDLKNSIQNHHNEMEDWKRDLDQRMDIFTQEFEEHEKSFQDQVQQRYSQLQASTDQLLEAEQQRVDDQIHLLFEKMDGIRAEGDVKAEELRQNLSGIETVLAQDLTRVTLQAQEKTASLLEEVTADIEQKTNSLELQLREKTETIQSRIARSDEQLELLEQRIQDQGVNQSTELEQLRTEAQNQAEDVRKSFYQIEETLRSELEEIRQKGTALADQTLTRISHDIETKAESLQESIGIRLKDMDVRAEKSYTDIDSKFTTLQERLESWIGDTEQFIAGLESRMAEVDRQVALTQEEYESRVSEYLERTKNKLQASEEDLHGQLEALGSLISRMRTDSQGELDDLKQTLSERVNQITQQIEEKIQTSRDDQLSELSGILRTVEAAVEDARGVLENRITQEEGRYKEVLQEVQRSIAEATDAATLREKQQLEEFSGLLTELQQQREVQLQEVHRSAGEGFKRIQDFIDSSLSKAGQELSRVEDILAHSAERCSELEVQTREQADTFGKEIETQIQNLKTELSGATEAMEQTVFSRIEQRLQEYETSFAYRIQGLENLSEDVEQLDTQIRKSIHQVSQEISEELDALGAVMKDQRKSDIDWAKNEMNLLREEMGVLEGDLNELKARAHDNVSEKLQSFEEEFFSDLKRRSENMEQRLDQWKQSVASSLEAIQTNFEATRTDVEQQYSRDLDSRLGALREEVDTFSQQIEQRILLHQKNLDEAVALQDAKIESQQLTLQEELSTLHERALQDIRSYYSSYQEKNDERFETFESGVESRIHSVENDLEVRNAQLHGIMDTIRSDVTLWQNQVLQQMKSAEGKVDENLSNFRTKMNTVITEVTEDVTRSNEELRSSTEEQRREIRQEVEDGVAKVQKGVRDISGFIAESMEGFKTQYGDFEESFSEQNRLLQSSIDTKMRDFRQFVSQTREDFEATQKRLVGGLESEVSVLSDTLAEIDKRQKQFLSQTKLFERADALKQELTGSIEQLKEQINQIKTEKREFTGIEDQVGKLKRIEEEVSQRYEGIASEKRRIEEMEANFSRLIATSQQIETQLAQVQNQHDSIIEIQQALRELDQLETQVEQRFERLEKRRGVVETTIEGVDRNFHQLTEVEQRVGDIQKSINVELPEKISLVESQITQLVLKKKEADVALKNVNQLNGLLQDIENRMKELSVAREWLARTETRLEEVGRQAQEQVQVLGAVLKQDERGGKPDKPSDSIPKSSRDIVIKLAHQGWKVEEIARTTKLSRGEVELILEMTQR